MKKLLNTKLKDMKAITLIALVVTIVVLIILAGVLISLTLGDNGIFQRAKKAKEDYANAQGYEEAEIAKMSNGIDSFVGGGRSYLNVKSGTYIGTGTSGKNNPTSLTFDEPPQIVIITPIDLTNGAYNSLMLIQGCKYTQLNTVTTSSGGGINVMCNLNWSNDGKTASWYVTADSGDYSYMHMNVLNAEYKWVAFF